MTTFTKNLSLLNTISFVMRRANTFFMCLACAIALMVSGLAHAQDDPEDEDPLGLKSPDINVRVERPSAEPIDLGLGTPNKPLKFPNGEPSCNDVKIQYYVWNRNPDQYDAFTWQEPYRPRVYLRSPEEVRTYIEERAVSQMDNDCSFETRAPRAPSVMYYKDSDNDGYGDKRFVRAMEQDGFVVINDERPADCDDSVTMVNPGAMEICDSIDNNCNGEVDEGCPEPSVVVEADPEPEPLVPEPKLVITIDFKCVASCDQVYVASEEVTNFDLPIEVTYEAGEDFVVTASDALVERTWLVKAASEGDHNLKLKGDKLTSRSGLGIRLIDATIIEDEPVVASVDPEPEPAPPTPDELADLPPTDAEVVARSMEEMRATIYLTVDCEVGCEDVFVEDQLVTDFGRRVEIPYQSGTDFQVMATEGTIDRVWMVTPPKGGFHNLKINGSNVTSRSGLLIRLIHTTDSAPVVAAVDPVPEPEPLVVVPVPEPPVEPDPVPEQPAVDPEPEPATPAPTTVLPADEPDDTDDWLGSEDPDDNSGLARLPTVTREPLCTVTITYTPAVSRPSKEDITSLDSCLDKAAVEAGSFSQVWVACGGNTDKLVFSGLGDNDDRIKQGGLGTAREAVCVEAARTKGVLPRHMVSADQIHLEVGKRTTVLVAYSGAIEEAVLPPAIAQLPEDVDELEEDVEELEDEVEKLKETPAKPDLEAGDLPEHAHRVPFGAFARGFASSYGWVLTYGPFVDLPLDNKLSLHAFVGVGGTTGMGQTRDRGDLDQPLTSFSGGPRLVWSAGGGAGLEYKVADWFAVQPVGVDYHALRLNRDLNMSAMDLSYAGAVVFRAKPLPFAVRLKLTTGLLYGTAREGEFVIKSGVLHQGPGWYGVHTFGGGVEFELIRW